jgi:surface antigen
MKTTPALLAIAAMVGASLAVPAPVLAQSKGLGSLFSCEGSGKKQEGGALIGAAAGAFLGSKVAKNEKTLGALVGAAAGAAAGSYIGCRMQSTDTALAQQATKKALETGQPQTWSNSRTGASGRIDVVSSSYGPPVDSRNLRFAQGVQSLPSYDALGGQYAAKGAANMRSTPSTSGKVVGKLAAGQPFDALGAAPNGGWILVGQSGYAVGYVAPGLVRPLQTVAASCRVINASISTSGQRPATERYSACQDNRGEWQLTQA